ncbi:MAG TPA: hypothetical protein VMV49_18265 [Candidatus Deferrimicrobium sp.]|nr:hypothetical protein [Candidatus Deferrimicrobium sp.]
MVEMKILKIITGLLILALFIPSIYYMFKIGLNQVYSTNPFFYDPTPYDFKVTDETVNVFIKKDGGIDIEYYITFYAYGHSIPIVDIGFPNQYYDLDGIQAEIDGHIISQSNIMQSEYLLVGVEIHLGAYTISSYSSGLLHVRGTCSIMVFKDDLKPFSLASVEFSPTWFSSSFCRRIDHLEVNFYFPENFIDKDSVKYHNTPYTSYSLNATHLVLTWEQNNIPSQQYTYGVSFPKSTVDKVYTSWVYGLFSPIQKVIGILILIAILFAGTILIYNSYQKLKRTAKYRYYKPTVGVECIGIKHDFSVAEAAITLGHRLDRVVAFIIFSLIRQNALKIISLNPGDPLTFEKNTPRPTTLQLHEITFLKDCFRKDPIQKAQILSNSALKAYLFKLIENLNTKMKAFSRKETEFYYKQLIEQAQIEICNTDTTYSDEKHLSQQFEWMILEPKTRRLRYDFRDRNIIVPYWYYQYHYQFFLKQSEYQAPSEDLTPITLIAMDGLEFANNIGNAIEHFCKGIAADFSEFTREVRDKIFPRPVHPWWYSSPGAAGGGRCACACACACAGCACACAGGGR